MIHKKLFRFSYLTVHVILYIKAGYEMIKYTRHYQLRPPDVSGNENPAGKVIEMGKVS